MVAHRADVYQSAELAGHLERTREGSIFQYDAKFLERQPESARGIALHLPLRREPFPSLGTNLHPFFANLLPEGLRLDALLRAVKSSPDDLLTLLVRAGSDTIGDVAVVAPEEPMEEATPTADLGKLDQLSFQELFEQSIAYDKRGMHERATVPGVQQKISAARLSFPLRATHQEGAYILKLNSPELPLLAENEYFFMTAAREVGIEAADCSRVRDRDGASGLLIRRFDRVVNRANQVTKVHQEDGCQLLNRYPADKYAVSLSDVAHSLSVCDTPALEVGKLIRLHAYSYLIANGDLHAKNVSIYASPKSGRLEMTPAYDLLSTLPYGDTHMALKLEGRDLRLSRKHFIAFGKRHGVRERAVDRILAEVCEGMGRIVSGLEEIGLTTKKCTQLRLTMEKRRDGLGMPRTAPR